MADVLANVPDSGLGRIDRLYHQLEKALNAFAALFLFILMCLACAEVFMRYVFNSPIHGQADLVEILIPTMGFFGLAYCQRLAGHVRMELLLARMKGRALWFFELVVTCTTLLICAVMIQGTYDHFLRAYELGDTSMDAEFLVWPPKLIICVGFCVLFVRLWIQFAGYIRLLAHPEAVPVGVPVNPTTMEIAEHEAEMAREAIRDGDGPADPGKEG